jgi:uncharacterized protein YggE
MGVAEQDIQTTNFSIYPQQQYDEQGQADRHDLRGREHRASDRDLDRTSLGDLAAAVDAGASSIYGIQFDVENKEEALSEARQSAVDDAAAQVQTRDRLPVLN